MTGFNYDEMRAYVKNSTLERIDVSRDVSDEEVREIIDEILMGLGRNHYVGLYEREQLAMETYNAIRRLDVIQELIDDEEVTEIMVNGMNGIFYEKKGILSRWKKNFVNAERLEDVVRQIAGKSNRMVNESTPIVDTRLENGARVNIVLPPIALNGPILTIRRFPKEPITMERLLSWGAITNEALELLRCLVQAGYNIFISGGTGSGKTTFLNALSEYIGEDERVITIEDSAELQLIRVKNLVRLETRNANVEGCIPIGIRELLRSALRMRPDRIIVGEVRGGEAIDMLQACNTGHDGSMSTGHANSAADMLSRLETMMLMGMDLPLSAIRRQIASGIDIIVHLGRLRDRSRRVLEISEVLGMKEGNIELQPLYSFEESGEEAGRIVGQLVKKNEPVHTEKLCAAGIKCGVVA